MLLKYETTTVRWIIFAKQRTGSTRWFVFWWRFELIHQLNIETVNSTQYRVFFTDTALYSYYFNTHYGKRKHCETAHQCRMFCLSVCGSTRSPSHEPRTVPTTVQEFSWLALLSWYLRCRVDGTVTFVNRFDRSSSFPLLLAWGVSSLYYFNNFTCLLPGYIYWRILHYM